MKCHLFRSTLIYMLVSCLLAFYLSGCGQVKDPGENTKPPSSAATKATEQEKITLRVAVEESLDGTMADAHHRFLKELQDKFSLEHREVEILIERIPREKGREEVLQRLRAELMMGEGPDILLLPTMPTDNRDYFGYVDPLIPDVQMAMRNGLFLDISEYYDADTALGKEALNQTVMEAGVLDDARYVLPLVYDMPVAYVVKDAFAESGVPQDVFSYGATEFLNTVAQLEDLADVGSLYQNYSTETPLFFNFFPELIDYETGQVTVAPEDLEAYFRAWQAHRLKLADAFDAGHGVPGISEIQYYYGSANYGAPGVFWGIDGFYASCESLLSAADIILMADGLGVELDMYPMRAVDGSVVADVTFYGAITSGCRNPELAYEFLRQFLNPEFQHEYNNVSFFGWPVRTVGSVSPICKRVGSPTFLSTDGMRIIKPENMTDEDLPILNAQINHVRFSILLEVDFGEAVLNLYYNNDPMAVEVDFQEEAEDWVKMLQIHADEG